MPFFIVSTRFYLGVGVKVAKFEIKEGVPIGCGCDGWFNKGCG